MTDNHLLLYRLAELKFEHEQQLLPVDILFDDEHIGDFVKSIQIDSPYQQMLLEGVLTETVRDEKLLVSFTVEGYFHYVLGEVIYHRTKGLSAEALKQIVEENKLNGAKEGVEQCLIREVANGSFYRLFEFIDYNSSCASMCHLPLAQLFIYNYKANINITLSNLFNRLSDNDYIVLENCLDLLKKNQKEELLAAIYEEINKIINPHNFNSSILYIESFMHIKTKGVLHASVLDNISKSIKLRQEEKIKIYIKTAACFLKFDQYENSLSCLYKARKLHSKNNSDLTLSEVYTGIANIKRFKEDYVSSLTYCNKALKFIEINHSQNKLVISNITRIKANTLLFQKKYTDALKLYNISLNILTKIKGGIHPDVALIHSNLSETYRQISNYNQSIFHAEKSLQIRIKTFGEDSTESATSLNNIGYIYFDKTEYDKAASFLYNALLKRQILLGYTHRFTIETHSKLCLALIYSEHYDKAISELIFCIKKQYHSGLKGILIANLYQYFGQAYFNNSDFLLASKAYGLAELYEHKYFKNSINRLPNIYIRLGDCYYKLRDYKKAMDIYTKGNNLYKHTLFENKIVNCIEKLEEL